MRTEMQKPLPALLGYWRARTLLLCLLPSSAVSIAFPVGGPAWRLGTALWVALAAGLLFVYHPARYRAAGYRVEGGWLVVQGGVLYRSTRTVPLGSIQLVSVGATPLLRLFGLRMLQVYAPGATVRLLGLSPETAAALQCALLPDGGGR